MTKQAENLTPMAHSAQNRCFGCGPANPIGLHLEFLLGEDGTVACLTTISDTFEGPSMYVHGGVIATLLDEAMSKAVRAAGVTAMTRQMEIEYLRPVPSGAPIRMESRVVRAEGRKHWTAGKIMNAAGQTLAEGKALFVEVLVKRVPVAPL